MKLKVYKLFMSSVKWILFLSLLNLVLPIEAVDSPLCDGKHQLSITERAQETADDGLVLSIQASHQLRVRRFKRIPLVIVKTNSVLLSKLNTSILLSTNDKCVLYRCDLVFKHRRGPPSA